MREIGLIIIDILGILREPIGDRLPVRVATCQCVQDQSAWPNGCVVATGVHGGASTAMVGGPVLNILAQSIWATQSESRIGREFGP